MAWPANSSSLRSRRCRCTTRRRDREFRRRTSDAGGVLGYIANVLRHSRATYLLHVVTGSISLEDACPAFAEVARHGYVMAHVLRTLHGLIGRAGPYASCRLVSLAADIRGQSQERANLTPYGEQAAMGRVEPSAPRAHSARLLTWEERERFALPPLDDKGLETKPGRALEKGGVR